jgi:hypothetical protein
MLIATTTIPLPILDTDIFQDTTLSILADYHITMASMIGHDILDIGSRNADMRARRQRGDVGLEGAVMNTLGLPGQFDVPNVADVSSI